MQNEVLCCTQLLVGRSECVQCKIDWRVVEILGLMDRSKTTGQVIVWATVLCSVLLRRIFLERSDHGSNVRSCCSGIYWHSPEVLTELVRLIESVAAVPVMRRAPRLKVRYSNPH